MENTIVSPLFFEFYGLPGCGKSTVSHLFAERLRQNGINVCEPSYCLDHHIPHLFRAIIKLFVYIFGAILHPRLFRKVTKIVKMNGYHGLGKVTQVSNVLQKLVTYLNPKNAQIYIWDQGLVQAAISLSVNGQMEASVVLQELSYLLPPNVMMICVLMDVEVSTSFERMRQRSTNDSRVENLEGDAQKIMMEAFDAGVSSVRANSMEIFTGFVLNASHEVDIQVDKLMDVIKLKTSDY